MNEAHVTVHADFWEDVRVFCLALLNQAGASLPTAEQSDVQRVCIAYFNVKQRGIDPRPRQVHQSRELAARALPDDITLGLQLITARAIAGEDLEPHLSERVVRPLTKDWLLSDWGIHHLHLRQERGDELLFAWLEPAAWHFIDVRDHSALDDPDLLEIVLANWPELLQPHRSIFPGRGDRLTAAQIREARRAGLQPLFPLSDGHVYLPRGGGLTTAGGSSARAVDRTHLLLRRARDHENYVRQNASGFAAQLGLSELHLRYDPSGPGAFETTTGSLWVLE